MATIIRLGKKVKALIKKLFPQRQYMSLVRRIERVKTTQKVVAMTFDDGPCTLPANPDNHGGKGLTQVLLDTMKQYDAHGTFDVIGFTGANYPDDIGVVGSASWGGIKFDHYPQFEADTKGGAVNAPQLVKQMIEQGHKISNHSYRHLLFGRKNIIYFKRKHFNSISDVLADLRKLDKLIEERDGFKMKLARPPHYVDNMPDGFDAYDAYALMRYQYMAASFDGAGWLASNEGYEDEVEQMVAPIREKLSENENFFCGQIIFQKDGYNMASRSPVADGLGKQLELLTNAGYKVVSVSELLGYSQFADLGEGDDYFEQASWLVEHGRCVCYRNNTVCPYQALTRGEAAMMIAPRSAIIERLIKMQSNPDIKKEFADVPIKHPYSSAIKWCVENGFMDTHNGKFKPDKYLSQSDLDSIIARVGGTLEERHSTVTRGDLIKGIYSAFVK